MYDGYIIGLAFSMLFKKQLVTIPLVASLHLIHYFSPLLNQPEIKC